MAAQKVNTSEPLPSLSWVVPNAPVERLVNFRLPGFSHSMVLVGLDCLAEMEVQANKDIFDGDYGIPGRQRGFWLNDAVPGKARNANQ